MSAKVDKQPKKKKETTARQAAPPPRVSQDKPQRKVETGRPPIAQARPPAPAAAAAATPRPPTPAARPPAPAPAAARPPAPIFTNLGNNILMLERPPLGRSNRRRGVVRGVFRVANVYASSLGQDKKLPVYSSWSEFYVVTTGQQWPRACQLAGCMRDAAVGGHMYAHGTTGHAWNLLLPICSHHNNSRTLDCVQNRYTTDGALFVNYLPTKLDVYMAVIAEKPEVSLYHDGVLRVRPTRGAAKA